MFIAARLGFFMGCFALGGPLLAQTCEACSVITTHQTIAGRTVTTLASESSTSAGLITVSASSAIGSSSVSSRIGSLGLGISLTAPGPSGGSIIDARAKFTDQLTFDFGDSGIHGVTVPVFVDGQVSGISGGGFQARFDFTGDFSHQTPFNRQLYNIVNNVSSYGGQSDSVDRLTKSGAIGTWLFTNESVHSVASGFADVVPVRSGQTYTVTYELYATRFWDGTADFINLMHTLTAGPFSGTGLNSVHSAAFGVLSQTNGSFAYDAASAVPEPATWGLMIAGFGLIGTAMRRRRVAVAA